MTNQDFKEITNSILVKLYNNGSIQKIPLLYKSIDIINNDTSLESIKESIDKTLDEAITIEQITELLNKGK
jgi:deoxyadenosine/deoxycytidine kinase